MLQCLLSAMFLRGGQGLVVPGQAGHTVRVSLVTTLLREPVPIRGFPESPGKWVTAEQCTHESDPPPRLRRLPLKTHKDPNVPDCKPCHLGQRVLRMWPYLTKPLDH